MITREKNTYTRRWSATEDFRVISFSSEITPTCIAEFSLEENPFFAVENEDKYRFDLEVCIKNTLEIVWAVGVEMEKRTREEEIFPSIYFVKVSNLIFWYF